MNIVPSSPIILTSCLKYHQDGLEAIYSMACIAITLAFTHWPAKLSCHGNVAITQDEYYGITEFHPSFAQVAMTPNELAQVS